MPDEWIRRRPASAPTGLFLNSEEFPCFTNRSINLPDSRSALPDYSGNLLSKPFTGGTALVTAPPALLFTEKQLQYCPQHSNA